MIRSLARALTHSGILRRLTARQRAAIAIFAFPVLLALATALYGLESAVYVLRSTPVEATVVAWYEWPGETVFDRGTINYEPIFTYDVDGETRRASVGSAHASFDLAIGDTATIRAIPSSRGNVRLDTWQGLWFLPVILGLFALVSLALAGMLWWIVHRMFFRKGPA